MAAFERLAIAIDHLAGAVRITAYCRRNTLLVGTMAVVRHANVTGGLALFVRFVRAVTE